MKVRLVDLAHARSGDKGDTANVGVIALPEWYPSGSRPHARSGEGPFPGVITGDVERFELPNLCALNFLLHGALDGGGRANGWNRPHHAARPEKKNALDLAAARELRESLREVRRTAPCAWYCSRPTARIFAQART